MDKEQEFLKELKPLDSINSHSYEKEFSMPPYLDQDHLVSKKMDTSAFDREEPLFSQRESEAHEFHAAERRAQDLFEKNYFSQALELLQVLHSRGLGSAKSYCLLGSSYHQLNQFKKALQAYKRSLEIDENHVESLMNLSILRMDLGDYERGVLTYKKAYQSYAQNQGHQWEAYMAEQHLTSGKSYFEKCYFHEALLEFLKAKPKTQKSSLNVDLLIVQCLWKLDRKREAIEKLQELKRYNLHSTKVSLLLGEFYFLSQKVPAAISEWERVLKFDPKNQKALRLLAKTQTIQSVKETDLA